MSTLDAHSVSALDSFFKPTNGVVGVTPSGGVEQMVPATLPDISKIVVAANTPGSLSFDEFFGGEMIDMKGIGGTEVGPKVGGPDLVAQSARKAAKPGFS